MWKVSNELSDEERPPPLRKPQPVIECRCHKVQLLAPGSGTRSIHLGPRNAGSGRQGLVIDIADLVLSRSQNPAVDREERYGDLVAED
jgi:hypothetical protein